MGRVAPVALEERQSYFVHRPNTDGGKNNARNYLDRGFDTGARGRSAPVVAQQKLGLLPDWRSGIGSCDRRHPFASRPNLDRMGL